MATKKVTMGLTEWDIKNTEDLQERLHARTKAAAVSSALALAAGLTKKVSEGEELMIRTKDGTLERILITGM